MQPNTRRFLSATLLLVGAFMLIYMRFDRPTKHKAKSKIYWAVPRSLIAEDKLRGFLEELLAQSVSGYTEAPDHFQIGKVLLDYASIRSISPINRTSTDFRKIISQLCEKDYLLTPADTIFINQQLRYPAEFSLSEYNLPNYHIVSIDSLQQAEVNPGESWAWIQELQQAYSTQNIFAIQSPLFSRNRLTAIVVIKLVCGSKCGSSETWLLRKRQNRWHKVRLLSRWVS
ncbi:hypothetical protein [Hymenobacter pini]|uniref:hypothetical protein n=1 Tax=Hymenobacter pini TaxID=2880879 RepID=UPI001CF490E3|nr:hypothetical protein [Hymenobacter pini]MCA8831594.1 hypothetical protein [Hymenobacter pini]